uniref:CSON006509 protein n=1 Tax=Culicoides sonorensis TaxID=179676 RepID=A0A336M0C7_CULSO
MKQRSKCEILMWLLICAFLLTVCGFQINEIVLKWKQNPLVISSEQKFSSIEEIPFPAITICPQTMPNQKKFHFSDFLRKYAYDEDFEYTDEEFQLLDAVSKMCWNQLKTYYQKLIEKRNKNQTRKRFNESMVARILEKYSLSHHLKLFACTGIFPEDVPLEAWDCNLVFKRILLKEGLCYTFNLLSKHDIFRSDVFYPLAVNANLIYPQDEIRRKYFQVFKKNDPQENKDVSLFEVPYRVKDPRNPLYVHARTYPEFRDSECNRPFVAFIHNPNEIPWEARSKGYVLHVEEFQRVTFSIQPTVIYSDTEIQTALAPEERGCYFANERYLRFFKEYSQNNCELECLTNATLINGRYFNCVLFWMPRTSDMHICSFEDYVSTPATVSIAANAINSCNCLPDCISISYEVKVSQTHSAGQRENVYLKEFLEKNTMKYHSVQMMQRFYDQKIFLSKYRDYNFESSLVDAVKEANLTVDFDIWNYTTIDITIFYEKPDFLAMRRQLSYSLADFFSQIGGILGCFLGISMFSFIELMYFCSVNFMKKYHRVVEAEEKIQNVRSISKIWPLQQRTINNELNLNRF